jgi:hypothetical protein
MSLSFQNRSHVIHHDQSIARAHLLERRRPRSIQA